MTWRSAVPRFAAAMVFLAAVPALLTGAPVDLTARAGKIISQSDAAFSASCGRTVIEVNATRVMRGERSPWRLPPLNART